MGYDHYPSHSSPDYTAPAAFAVICLEQGEYVQDTLITTGTRIGGRPN